MHALGIQHVSGKLMSPEILRRVVGRIGELGGISDREGMLERSFLSQANLAAAECVMSWMVDAGMMAGHDAGGTVRGVLEGRGPERAPFLIGSHIDTVTDGGMYDGGLGVIAGIAAVEQLREEGVELEFPVHVLGFSDEEGLRFQSAYLGSAGITGGLGKNLLGAWDGTGRTLGTVLAEDGWHEGAERFHYGAGDAEGYLELHIEQGRVLEEAGEAVAVVSGIFAQARLRVRLEGLADHAGTTPMDLRRDALAGAAECVLAAEKRARGEPGLVATVGKMMINPGASNAIPGVVEFTLDVRHAEDAGLEECLEGMRNEFEEIGAGRDLEMKWEVVQVSGAVKCDGGMIESLLNCVEAVSGMRRVMGSGAGHDGVMMGRVMPLGMIFVRCRGGLSHHPDEYAGPEDVEAGIDVMVEFLKRRNR